MLQGVILSLKIIIIIIIIIKMRATLMRMSNGKNLICFICATIKK